MLAVPGQQEVNPMDSSESDVHCVRCRLPGKDTFDQKGVGHRRDIGIRLDKRDARQTLRAPLRSFWIAVSR